MKLLTTTEIMKKYGPPGPSNLVRIEVAFPLIVAWDKKFTVKGFECHKLVAEPMKKVFSDLLCHYGIEEIKRLGINLYGGCYNFRKTTSGNGWSRHSWGIAIDLDPERNTYSESHKTARFARPEYKAMIDIFYLNGFLSLGRERDFDWMHMEIAS